MDRAVIAINGKAPVVVAVSADPCVDVEGADLFPQVAGKACIQGASFFTADGATRANQFADGKMMFWSVVRLAQGSENGGFVHIMHLQHVFRSHGIAGGHLDLTVIIEPTGNDSFRQPGRVWIKFKNCPKRCTDDAHTRDFRSLIMQYADIEASCAQFGELAFL